MKGEECFEWERGGGMGKAEINKVKTRGNVAIESFLRYKPSESMEFGIVSKKSLLAKSNLAKMT